MSVEAITESLHENMNQKPNDSPETEDEKKNRYLNKTKPRITKESTDKLSKFEKKTVTDAEYQIGHNRRNARLGERNAQNAKMGRTKRKTNRMQEQESSSAEGDDCSPNTIHSINQKIHSTRSINKDGPEFFTFTALANNRQIKFIIDSGSPVTLILKSQFNRITPLPPLGTEYRDVKDNRINIEGKTKAKVETDGKQRCLEILVTTKN